MIATVDYKFFPVQSTKVFIQYSQRIIVAVVILFLSVASLVTNFHFLVTMSTIYDKMCRTFVSQEAKQNRDHQKELFKFGVEAKHLEIGQRASAMGPLIDEKAMQSS